MPVKRGFNHSSSSPGLFTLPFITVNLTFKKGNLTLPLGQRHCERSQSGTYRVERRRRLACHWIIHSILNVHSTNLGATSTPKCNGLQLGNAEKYKNRHRYEVRLAPAPMQRCSVPRSQFWAPNNHGKLCPSTAQNPLTCHEMPGRLRMRRTIKQLCGCQPMTPDRAELERNAKDLCADLLPEAHASGLLFTNRHSKVIHQRGGPERARSAPMRLVATTS
jgi:hypothetical protein